MWISIGFVAAVAAVVRLVPSIASGALFHRIEYDAGVMFAAALSLISGQAPYAEFVYLHPPGSILLFSPAAVVAAIIGEPGALALIRIGVAAVGVLNVVLIGALLRRFGLGPVVIGAGLYAVWPVVTFTERQVMLEPFLNALLLGTLLLVRSQQRAVLTWLAGMLLGLALSIKYWAIVDIGLVGLVVFARGGARTLWRFLGGAALAAGAVALAFFARDPSAMWQQTVTTQLLRPASDTGAAARVNMLSMFWTTPAVERLLPWQLWAVFAAGLLIIAALPLVGALRRRMNPREWTDPTWWGIIVWAHAGVLLFSGVFFDHYLAWLIAPLSLTTGAAAAALRGSRRHAVVAAASAMLVVAGLVQMRGGEAVPSRDALEAWAREGECVWGDAASLLAANALRRGLAGGCDFSVDLSGTGLMLYAREAERDDQTTWRAAIGAELRAQLEHSDRAILSLDHSAWPFDPATSEWFRRNFRSAGSTDGFELWIRRDL